jgi:hypothetical protein
MKFRSIRFALVAATLLAGLAQAQTVAPPPLPIGSQQARPEPGMSEPERKRAVRAHHHKAHNKRDYTQDDSVRAQPVSTGGVQPVGPRAGDATAPRAGAAPIGGNGTGPAREKTDRGASGWFFGSDKK